MAMEGEGARAGFRKERVLCPVSDSILQQAKPPMDTRSGAITQRCANTSSIPDAPRGVVSHPQIEFFPHQAIPNGFSFG